MPVHSYDNFSDYLKALTETPRIEGAADHSQRRETGWAGANYKDTVTMASEGWAEGREKLSALSATLSKRLANKAHRPIVNFEVSGDMFDIGRVVSGIPESFMVWEDSEVEHHGTKIIKLVVNMTFSSGVDGRIVTNRGVTIVSLVDSLEAAGFRCEVWAVFAIQAFNHPDMGHTYIKVKDASMPLQLDQLAFLLMHPAVLRRLHFKFMESVPEKDWAVKVTNSAYGRPAETDMKGDINFGCLMYGDPRFESTESMEKFILDTLQEQGIKLEE